MNEDIYILLIYKKLEGELSEKEARQLAEWLEADAEHQALMEDLTLAYAESDTYMEAEAEGVDVQAAFETQLKRIEVAEDAATIVQMEKPPKQQGGFYRMFAVAATIALLIAASIWLMNQSPDAPSTELIVKTSTAKKNIELADGSIVTLEAGSEVVYPSVFDANQRVVELKRGTATFNVAKNQGQFKVKTNSGTVTVLGTIFKLTAPEKKGTLALNVIEGKVNIKNTTATKSMNVVANEAVTIVGEGMYKTKWGKAPIMFFDFESTPLNVVLKTLGVHFEKEIIVQEAIQNCPMTVKFEGQNLEETIQIIKDLTEAEVEITSNGYKLKGERCN